MFGKEVCGRIPSYLPCHSRTLSGAALGGGDREEKGKEIRGRKVAEKKKMKNTGFFHGGVTRRSIRSTSPRLDAQCIPGAAFSKVRPAVQEKVKQGGSIVALNWELSIAEKIVPTTFVEKMGIETIMHRTGAPKGKKMMYRRHNRKRWGEVLSWRIDQDFSKGGEEKEC